VLKTCPLFRVKSPQRSSSSSIAFSHFIRSIPSKSCHWSPSESFHSKSMLTDARSQGHSQNVNVHGRKHAYLYVRWTFVRRRTWHFRTTSQSGMHIRSRCYTTTVTLTRSFISRHMRVCTTLTNRLMSRRTFSRGRLQMQCLPLRISHPLRTLSCRYHSYNYNHTMGLMSMAIFVAGNSLQQFHLAASPTHLHS